MSESEKLKRAFRLGVMRASSGEFKSVANVGITGDGGVFVVPAQLRGYSWRYGVVRKGEAPKQAEHVETDLRPKLHYHQSGIASVTLTGSDIERRRVQLPRLPCVVRGQVFSIVSYRVWEFPTVSTNGDARRGDVFTVETRWPDALAWTLSIVSHPSGDPFNVALDGPRPIGHIRGDPTRFVVDLSWYGRNAMLVGHVDPRFDDPVPMEPGVSVVALPWKPGGPSTMDDAFGLWSTSMNNPVVKYEEDDDIPTEFELTTESDGVVREVTWRERSQERLKAAGENPDGRRFPGADK